MARTAPRPAATLPEALLPLAATCPSCAGPLWLGDYNRRTVTTLPGVLRLRLGIRRCRRDPEADLRDLGPKFSQSRLPT